jgi:subtilase family serine protease
MLGINFSLITINPFEIGSMDMSPKIKLAISVDPNFWDRYIIPVTVSVVIVVILIALALLIIFRRRI